MRSFSEPEMVEGAFFWQMPRRLRARHGSRLLRSYLYAVLEITEGALVLYGPPKVTQSGAMSWDRERPEHKLSCSREPSTERWPRTKTEAEGTS